jgi:hypothetical protein
VPSDVTLSSGTAEVLDRPPVGLNNPDYHKPQKAIGFLQALRIPVRHCFVFFVHSCHSFAAVEKLVGIFLVENDLCNNDWNAIFFSIGSRGIFPVPLLRQADKLHVPFLAATLHQCFQ